MAAFAAAVAAAVPSEHCTGHEDEYEVQRPIGSGSFGQVFLVLHKAEQREYVMKSIELKSVSEEGREATESEVQLLSNLKHPNIVAYRDSFVDRRGHLCILMEWCEHGDISAYLQEAKRVHKYPDEHRLTEWFIQITLALHALHHRKILHRDLKTPNIFLTGSKTEGAFALKLGDFGIAKALNSTGELAKTQIGTPFYMSPELINNQSYGVKSDIWGLGCVLYEIINGKRAFDAQSLNGLALKIIKGSYNNITVTCSPGMQALIKVMLSTKPKNRPSLREILLTAVIRARIHRTVKNVVTIGQPEQRYSSEQAFSKQLACLGLGAPGNGRPRDRRNLEQRLQRAEQRKQREEEVLQHTVALLEQHLQRPEEADHDEWRSPRSQVSCARPSPRSNASRDPSRDQMDLPGRVSHSSHRQSQRRKEEAHTRFDEAATASQAAHQRLNASERRQMHVSGGDSLGQRQRAHTDFVHTGGAPEVYDGHASSASRLADPHPPPRERRSGSKGSRHARGHEPDPPPQLYGEPHPPRDLRQATGGCRTGDFHASGARAEAGRSGHGRPKLAPQLEAISGHYVAHAEVEKTRCPHRGSPQASPRPSEVMDSMSSGSLTEVQELEEWEGLSDMSEEPDQKQGRQQTLQQRINHCEAAITRQKMTIEMLRYSVATGPGGEPLNTFGSVPEGSVHMGCEDSARRPAVPAVVQDCSMRLMRRCLEGLGSEKFHAAKRCLQASLNDAELPSSVRSRMLELLGIDKIGFLSMLDQLVYMERRWGIQEN